MFKRPRLQYVEWCNVTANCIGATLLAINIEASPWAFVIMGASSTTWAVIGWIKRDSAAITQWSFFTALNVIAIWRWLV